MLDWGLTFIASVRIVWDRTSVPSDVWIDFYNLIKIGGIGKIINKTAIRSKRA
jgi:hypothetical protein